MFDSCNTTTEQGNVGEAFAIAYYTKNGFIVSKPLFVNSPYDLIVDNGSELKRVQIKTTNRVLYGSYNVNIKTSGSNARVNETKPFASDVIDELFVLADNGCMWCIPTSVMQAKFQMSLTEKFEAYKVLL